MHVADELISTGLDLYLTLRNVPCIYIEFGNYERDSLKNYYSFIENTR